MSSANLPARLGYARDESLRSQLSESQTRNLESTNETTPATGHLAAIDDPGGAGVTGQLAETGVILFRLQLGPQGGILLHRRAFACVAIDPGHFGHRRTPNVMAKRYIATVVLGRGRVKKSLLIGLPF